MALTEPRLSQRKLLQIGLEAVAKGTEAATFYDMQVWDLEIKPTSENSFRRDTGLTTGVTVTGVNDGMQTGECSFTTYMITTGSNALIEGLSAAIQGCGTSLSTATYTPESTHGDQKTVSIKAYVDGKLKKLTGGSGNFTWTVDGNIVVFKFEFSGLWAAPTDAGLPGTCSWSTRAPHSWGNASSTFTIDTNAIRISTFEFSTGNTVAPRMHMGQPLYYFASKREPTFKIDPETALVADYDFYGKRQACTPIAIAMGITNGTDVVTLTIPKLVITDIAEGDREGIFIEDVTGTCCSNTTGGGDDEYSIVVT
jgi:hypothetical protein